MAQKSQIRNCPLPACSLPCLACMYHYGIPKYSKYPLDLCNPLLRLLDCLSIVVLPGVQGLLLARVYATSQHNQGMGWVLWAFSLLLYIGSLGTAVFITVKNVCIVTAQDQDAIILVDTINTVFLMLFDTLVVVVTIYNTLGLMRHSREFQKFPGKSLSQTLAEQGLIRYGFVLSITLAGGITRKVLRASIAGILTLVQDSLSVIIICRCHLVLRERVAHPNGTTHSAHHPLTSFRAATRQIHNSFMQEFGNLSIEKFGTSEAIEPHREDDPSSTAVAGIELEEIPRGRELANAVNESASEALDKPQHAAASTGEELIGV
ncbi:hypothetical protein JB92DRAFT_3022536 [Gautieria morchelliformis]|nr:hypothetical protein JB92DRAFT_3022536 [Gautieria morchelliformis]